MFDLKKYPTHQPSLTDLANLFNEKLKDYFLKVDVSVVDCPDLTLEPFNLAGKGLSSNEPNSNKVIDVGGEPFLIPLPQLERPPYDIVEISKKSGLNENGHVLGAACGPFKTLGCNSELIPNVAYNSNTIKNNTKCSHMADNENYVVKNSPNTNFNLLGNFYACEGVSGKVLKVKVSQRKNEDDNKIDLNGNLVSIMRKILNENFKPDTPVSMGGCFIYKGGKAKIHIMPEFSKTPLINSDLVKKWLKFYEFNGPLLCLTAFHSHNNYNLNLREEHTHCYGIENNVAGGHYHYELDAKNADYEGYFNVAAEIVRVDNTGNITVKFD